MNFLKKIAEAFRGKKTYIVCVLMILLGILQGDQNLILEGLAIVGIRLGISGKWVINTPRPWQVRWLWYNWSMEKEKIVGEKLVIKECKKWEKRSRLAAKLLKKDGGPLIIPKISKECEKCGGELAIKMIGDESYDKCVDCGWFNY